MAYYFEQYYPDMASASATPPEQQELRETQEGGALEQTGQTPEIKGQTVELRGEAADDPAIPLRKRFDTANTSPLAKLGDVSLSRTFEDLHKKFTKMLYDDLRHDHGRLTCSDVTPVDPDSSRYFQARRGNFIDYQDYIGYFWAAATPSLTMRPHWA